MIVMMMLAMMMSMLRELRELDYSDFKASSPCSCIPFFLELRGLLVLEVLRHASLFHRHGQERTLTRTHLTISSWLKENRANGSACASLAQHGSKPWRTNQSPP